MKLNWGHKIAIIYTAFAGSMVAMLIYSTTFTHELVTEDYYREEQNHQARIDARRNLHNAAFTLRAEALDGSVLVTIDGLPADAEVEGQVTLYKPDNQAMDQTLDLVLVGGKTMRIEPLVRRGRYRVEVSFEVDGKRYAGQKQIVL